MKLENDYHQLPEAKNDMHAARSILNELKHDKELYGRVLYTEFHAVEKLNLGMKW